MKKLLLICFCICATAVTNAQVAMLNSQKVIKSMPVFAKLDTLIAKEQNSYAIEYNKKQNNLNGLVKVADSLYKIDQKAANTTKAIADAQTVDKELKAYADMANKKIAEYKQIVEKPYTDKITAAIKVVAIRKKIMQVLDSSTVNALYLNPLGDITDEVINELKLKF